MRVKSVPVRKWRVPQALPKTEVLVVKSKRGNVGKGLKRTALLRSQGRVALVSRMKRVKLARGTQTKFTRRGHYKKRRVYNGNLNKRWY